MEILLVEDQDKKADDVEAFLSKGGDFTFTRALSFSSGRDYLFEKKFDLVLLDMTIPMFDGGDLSDDETGGLLGKDLIDLISELSLNTFVIIVSHHYSFKTQFIELKLEEVIKQTVDEFPEIVHGGVHYKTGDLESKQNLLEMIREI